MNHTFRVLYIVRNPLISISNRPIIDWIEEENDFDVKESVGPFGIGVITPRMNYV